MNTLLLQGMACLFKGAAAQPMNYLVNVGLDLRPFKVCFWNAQSIAGSAPGLIQFLRYMKQRFGWIATIIEAGSSQFMPFYQPYAQLMRIQGGDSRTPSRSSANGQEIIIIVVMNHRFLQNEEYLQE